MERYQGSRAADSSNDRAVTIVRSVLNAIRTLTSGERSPGIKEITAMVQCDPGVAELLNPPSGVQQFQKEEFLRQKKEVELLREQLQKNVTNRRAMVVQLDAAERQAIKAKEFMLRAFLAMIRHVDTSKDRQLKNTVTRIRDLLKKRAPLHELDAAFQQLKEFEFTGESGATAETPPPAKLPGLARFKRPAGESESEPNLARSRKRYQKLIDGLKSTLDAVALRDIAAVEQRLHSALEAYDLPEIHKELRKLLKAYVQRLSGEREAAAGFILEIEERLGEVQRRILHCSAAFRDTGDAGTRFAAAVEQEMSRMQGGVDAAKNLEELKSRVVGSIGLLREAIEETRKAEWQQAQKTEEEMAALNKTLERMTLEIASAKKRTERLETELLSDPLTDTHSRRACEEQMAALFESHRRGRREFAIFLLDVDGFRAINERYGHNVGNICLKGIAKKIQPLLRESDLLSRFGGDEFVAVLPEVRAPGAEAVAEKVRDHIEKTNFLHKGEKVRITVSIGVAPLDAGASSPAQLLGQAEQALDRAKEAGGNRVAVAG